MFSVGEWEPPRRGGADRQRAAALGQRPAARQGPRLSRPQRSFLAPQTDPLERQADAFAAQAVAGGGFRALAGPPRNGHLPPGLRSHLEGASGVPLGAVHLQDDATAHRTAATLGAEAYTTGTTIGFAAGRLNTSSIGGLRLLAHEVGHVIQQSSGVATGTIQRQAAATVPEKPRIGPADYARQLDLVFNRPAAAVETYNQFYNWAARVNRPEPLVSTPIPPEVTKAAVEGNRDYISDFLQGLWIRDIITTLQLLRLSFRPTFDAIVAMSTGLPARTRVCVEAVNDPEELQSRLEALPGSMIYNESGRLTRYADLPADQADEVAAFMGVATGRRAGSPQWADPVLGLPRAKQPAPLTEFQQSMLDFIRRYRAAMPVSPKLRPSGPGYIYSGDPTKDRPPESVVSGDVLMKEMWAELNTEGSASAINTWDVAKFSWGRGWAAPGDLPKIMIELYKSDPKLIDELYQAGFTTTAAGKFLIVDDATGLVHEGDAALDVIRKDQRLLSFLISTGEAPQHEVGLTEATWSVLSRRQALPAVDPAMREQTKLWPVSSIRFVEHCLHFAGLLQWSHFKDTRGDLAKIVTVMIKRLGAMYPLTPSGARIATGYGYVPLMFAPVGGKGAMDAVLAAEEDLPTDLESGGSYPGVVFFPPAFMSGYYHETVSTKGGRTFTRSTDMSADSRILYDPNRPDKSGGRARRFIMVE